MIKRIPTSLQGFARLTSVVVLLWACLLVGGSVSAQPPAALPDPGVVKARLHNILSQPEFSSPQHQESDFSKWIRGYYESFEKKWQSVKTWLEKWWNRITDLFGGLRGLSASGNFFLALFVALFIGICAYLLVRYIRSARRAALAHSDVAGAATLPLDDGLAEALTRSADEWMAEARRCASEHDYARAIRAILFAALVDLDGAGLLECTRSATNGEYIGELGRWSNAGVTTPFQSLVRQYERKWYGRFPAQEQDYLSASRDLTDISAATETGKRLEGGAADAA